MLDWMPVQGSTWAQRVDFINNFITYIAVFCTIAITGAMVYFAFRYRRKGDGDKVAYITHSTTLETLWTAIPTLVCIFVFYYGTVLYQEMRVPPSNPIEVNVKGYQWWWEFQYPTGKKVNNELVVPVDKPIRLIMKSNDVNHSFFIPAMRVKEDVIASTYHYLWFTPTKLGKYPIFCTEYCGTQHSGMLAELRVVTEAEYLDYVSDRGAGTETLTPEQLGAKAYKAKGCNSCHSLDGTKLVGPTFKGLYGRKAKMQSGEEVTSDESYIRESILNPQAKIVEGYPPVMPALQLSDDEINGVIAYIKTLQ